MALIKPVSLIIRATFPSVRLFVIQRLGFYLQPCCTPPPFLTQSATGHHLMVSKIVRYPDITSCTCGTTTRLHTIAVARIACSASIQHARGIHLAPQLAHPVVQHIRSAPKASTLPICYFVPPRYIVDIVPPSRSSSLIDTFTSSLSSFMMSMWPLVSHQLLYAFTDCFKHSGRRPSLACLPFNTPCRCTHVRLYYHTDIPLTQLLQCPWYPLPGSNWIYDQHTQQYICACISALVRQLSNSTFTVFPVPSTHSNHLHAQASRLAHPMVCSTWLYSLEFFTPSVA